MNLEIIIPLIVGVFSALTGYWLGKLSKNTEEGVEAWKAKYGELEAKVAKLKTAKVIGGSLSRDLNSAKLLFGKTIKENDLKIIEGIGPKIEELFVQNGINTWKKLASSTPEQCKAILDSAGDRFKMHVPASWPDQAALASQGNWAELKRKQEELELEF